MKIEATPGAELNIVIDNAARPMVINRATFPATYTICEPMETIVIIVPEEKKTPQK
jgi:hypothetical protein